MMNDTIIGGGLQTPLTIGKKYILRSEGDEMLWTPTAISCDGTCVWGRDAEARECGFSIESLNRMDIVEIVQNNTNKTMETATKTQSFTHIGATVRLNVNAEDLIFSVIVIDANRILIGLRDMTNGQVVEKQCTTTQLGAIFALMMAGDQFDPATSESLYELAEQVCNDLPVGMRPIP